MDISVIIVNYNVKALLEQTILSVIKSIGQLQVEIIVIDNQSVDGSCEMVKSKFKEVVLIENKVNVGFGKANNQGIKIAKGDLVLLLNPDTVVSENTLEVCQQFFSAHKDAGAIGVKMIDGSGKFLPESKRGLPTPMVSFYKMSGLSKLFPNSKKFGKYHLSYLSENSTHEVDILSGAFMMIRKKVLDQVGYFDEAFFMYGEDIDLSYRIQKAGYKNYYLSDTTIIHYKGESTKKQSVNYVKIFYQAMAIFAKKHFTKNQGWWFSLCIQLAIIARAFIALIVRIFKKVYQPLLDFIIIYLGCFGIMKYWEVYNKFVVGGYYPSEYYIIHIPIYILFFIGGIGIYGAYKYYYNLNKLARGIVFSSIVLVAIYALLPENLRFSRALLVLDCTWALISTFGIRLLTHFIQYKHFDTLSSQISNIAIVGTKEEAEKVIKILSYHLQSYQIVGYINPKNTNLDNDWLGPLEHVESLCEIHEINELVFCSKDISSEDIMNTMSKTKTLKIKYKIMPEQSNVIIGSNDKNSTGEFYSYDFKIQLSDKLIYKRILDIILCLIFILLFPLFIFFKTYRLKILVNIIPCLFNQKTWVGYCQSSNLNILPKLPNAVFENNLIYSHLDNKQVSNEKINFIYASKYSINKDIFILSKAFF